MAEKPVKGDKIWRGAALVVLCGLVYYLSYDHGRQSVLPQLEKLRLEAVATAEAQRREILRLTAALADCGEKAPASEAAPLDRVSLKVNQSRILFNGQLVVTLITVESTENKAVVQLNFINEERLVTEILAAGGSCKFTLEKRNWALVLSALSLSTANLNLVELKTL